MRIEMSPKILRWYLMAMWSMRKQKFIDQLACKISEIIIKKNGRLAAILDFISAKFVMGYSCVEHYNVFYIQGLASLHFSWVT